MEKEAKYILAVIAAVLAIPIMHGLNIILGDATFMGLWTWGGFHIHLALVGFIALCLGLILVMFVRKESKGEVTIRHTVLMIAVMCLVFALIAMLWDWNDLISGDFLTGVR